MKVLAAIFAFNEGEKLKMVVERFPAERDYDVLIMDDGSSDGSTGPLGESEHVTVLKHGQQRGVGAGMKTVFRYALSQGYDVVIPMAGNNKDNPLEIPRLLAAIVAGYDFVQGSRYLPGGDYQKMPLYRQLATRYIHPSLFSLISGQKITDSTNGFRALRVTMLEKLQSGWEQDWLEQYELEPYLFYQAIKRGFRVTEVPVSKIYPPKKLGYTKMKPLIGWWSILRPLVYLGLGIKR